MLHPNPNMLLRIAQGDAFGASVEFLGDTPVGELQRQKALKFVSYYKHPTHSLEAGQYTDDTQMSIAVAEVLLSDARYTEEAFAQAFVRCFKRDPRKGYAKSFQAFLEEIVDGQEFLERIRPTSDRNGAAMRAVPIGVLPNPDEVERIAELQGRITHNTVGGVMSSKAVALMSHFALYSDKPLVCLPDYLESRLGRNAVPMWSGGPVTGPNLGLNTASAVLTLVSTVDSLLKIAKVAVEWEGDVDSVLAIAFGIASSRMTEELPPFFEGGLEDGTYGKKYLKLLGIQLMDKFNESRD